jgi:hypothetical protein
VLRTCFCILCWFWHHRQARKAKEARALEKAQGKLGVLARPSSGGLRSARTAPAPNSPHKLSTASPLQRPSSSSVLRRILTPVAESRSRTLLPIVASTDECGGREAVETIIPSFKDPVVYTCDCGNLRDPDTPLVPHVKGGFCYEGICRSCWIQHMARHVKGVRLTLFLRVVCENPPKGDSSIHIRWFEVFFVVFHDFVQQLEACPHIARVPIPRFACWTLWLSKILQCHYSQPE